jgi:hypothetical protein
MTLAQAVEKIRPAVLKQQAPDLEMLKCMAELIELNHAEYAKYGDPEQDMANLDWSEYLLKQAKLSGWFRLCIKHGLLTEKYIHWPNQDWIKQPKLKEIKDKSNSVRTISGGAFEQKRRKH